LDFLLLVKLNGPAEKTPLCHTNFYTEIIDRDGIKLERYIPPRSLAARQNRPVSRLANFSPIFGGSTDRDEWERL